MNPYEAFSLYGDTPEVRDYLASLVHYTTEWDRGHVETRKKVYALMTGIQTLTVSVHGYVGQDFYLRPTIKSITLNFNLSFTEDREAKGLGLLHNGGFLAWFQTLETYLREHPDSQLEELHINFGPEVSLFLCIPNYHTVNYDRYGPIYEDEDWVATTSVLKPSEYLCCLDGDSSSAMNEIGDKLLDLLRMMPWKAITLPYHFPSAALVAEDYPFTRFTEEIEESPTRVVKYIRELNAEHRESVPRIR